MNTGNDTRGIPRSGETRQLLQNSRVKHAVGKSCCGLPYLLTCNTVLIDILSIIVANMKAFEGASVHTGMVPYRTAWAEQIGSTTCGRGTCTVPVPFRTVWYGMVIDIR